MFPPNADVLVKANPHSHVQPIKPTGDANATRFGRPIFKYSTPPATTNGSPTAGTLPTQATVVAASHLLGNYQAQPKKKNQTYQSNPNNPSGRRRYNNNNNNNNNNTTNHGNTNLTFISHHPKKASLDLATAQPLPTVHQFVPQSYANLFAEQQAHFAHFSQHLVMSSIASAPKPAVTLKSQPSHTSSHHQHSSPTLTATGNGNGTHSTTPCSDTINTNSNSTTPPTPSTPSSTSVAPPASSYSLDFLHYVGVQMTAGGHGIMQSTTAGGGDHLHPSNQRSVMVNVNNGSANANLMQKHQSFFAPNGGRSYDKPVQMSPSGAPSIGYYQQHPTAGNQPHQQLKSPTAFYHMGHQQFQHAMGQQHALVAAAAAAQQQHQQQQHQQQQQQQQQQQTQTVAYHMNNNTYHTNNRNLQMGNGGKKSWYNNYPKNKKFLSQINHQHNQQQTINNCSNNNNNNNNSTTINNNYSTNLNGSSNNNHHNNLINNNHNSNNINANNNVNSSSIAYGLGQSNRKEVPDISCATTFPMHLSRNGNNTTIACTAKSAPRPPPKSVSPPPQPPTPAAHRSGSTSSLNAMPTQHQMTQPPPALPSSPRLPVVSAATATTDATAAKTYRCTSTPVEYDSDSSHSSYNNNARTNGDGQHYKSCSSSIGSDSTTQSSSDQSVGMSRGGGGGGCGFYGSGQTHEPIWSGAAPGHGFNGGYQYNSSGALDAAKEMGRTGQREQYGGDYLQQPQQKRSYSGRNSPQNNRGRRNHASHFLGHRLVDNHIYTPPDRYLNRSHLVEQKTPPDALLNGSKYDSLSQMIWDRWCAAQQTEETYKKKMYLWRYLYVCVKKTFPRYSLYLVGSTMSGFGSETSDVDMCLVSRFITDMEPRVEAVLHLTHLKEHLLGSTVIFDSFNLIQAKVPILRFKDSLHLLEVDLNFNNCVGIRNTHLLYCYSQMDWRLRPLVLVVKLWAQFHNINNAKDMTISSYSLVLMTIHFLQYAVAPAVLPCLHTMYPLKFQTVHDINMIDMNEDMEPYYSENTQSLGELFLKFLEYYSNFAYSHFAISVRTASVLPIDECRMARSLKNDPHQWKELCIEEPFDLTNTARSVYDNVIFEQIKSVFVRSCRTLHDSMDLNSLFDQPFMLPTSSSPLGGGGVGGHVLATMAAAAASCATATTNSSATTDASTSSISSASSSADTSS